MDRRQFIAAIGSVAVLSPPATAQEAGRVYRLGILIPAIIADPDCLALGL